MADDPSIERDVDNRRRFHVQSKFGSARRWRSRKNRPCDVCRRRKTACVINEQPPCSFCKERGLECGSRDEPLRPRQHDRRIASVEDETHQEARNRLDGPTSSEYHGPILSNDVSFDSPRQIAAISDSTLAAAVAPTIPSPDYSISKADPLGESRVITLEDGENRTANLMGLSAEQDTDILASFRSIIMTETNRVAGNIVQVSAGDPSAGLPPCHFNILRDSFMSYDNCIRDEASQTIETKVGEYGPALVRLYFRHVHPVYCVVSKCRFLRAYRDNKLSIPASLRGVVYGLGAVYWKHDSDLQEIDRPFHQWELFHAAQASLERELDAPNLWKIQAALLMVHEQASGNCTFETARTWTLSAQATACAQMIGLHRDPSDWNIASWEISLRKKLWWATYVNDTWSSVCHGNPPHIYRSSYTTSDLDLNDLRFDEDVPSDLQDMVDVDNHTFDVTTAARFIELVKLTQILHSLLDAAFSDESCRIAAQNRGEQESKILSIGKDLDTWFSLMPRCVTMELDTSQLQVRNNAPLHLAYYATKVLFLRALLAPASMTARRDPQSSLRRFFETATKELALVPIFMDGLQGAELQAYWGRHARSQLLLIGNFFVYLFLSSSDAEQVHRTFTLLEQFYESMQRISDLVDGDFVQLIRPLALRIDSFFTQAAQIMRGTPTTPNSDPELVLLLTGRW